MTPIPSSAPVRRAASAERFAHKAMTIVNAVLLANAERNERLLALARLVMCLAYLVRLVVWASTLAPWSLARSAPSSMRRTPSVATS